MNRRRWLVALLALTSSTSCVFGCSRDVVQPSASGATSPPVLASVAASAAAALESLGAEFQAETGIEVKWNAGASSGLAGQILEGSHSDLFLSANSTWASKIVDAGLATRSVPLLTNDLVLIVPRGNPARVRSPSDLRTEAVKRVALAGENVPAGSYADQALSKLGLLESLVAQGKVARGADVRTTLRYVARGEAEAGVVYSTDVLGESDVEAVHTFDRSLHDEIVYVLVQIESSRADDAATRLFDFLAAPERADAYERFGFRRVAASDASSP